MPAVRQSRRSARANTRHTDDPPVEVAGIKITDATESKGEPLEIGSSEESSGPSSRAPRRGGRRRRKSPSADDADFIPAAEPTGEANDDDEEIILDEGEEDEELEYEQASRRGKRALKFQELSQSVHHGPHSRGNWMPNEHASKPVNLQVTFGTDERDILNMIYVRDRWSGANDSAVPSKASLEQEPNPQQYGSDDYGAGRTYGVDATDLEREATSAWDWYYQDDLGGQFRKRQRVEGIGEEEAVRTYLPVPSKERHKVRIGPFVDGQQRAFELRQHDVLDFGQAWPKIDGVPETTAQSIKATKRLGRPSKKQTNDQESQGVDQKTSQSRARQGWIVNMGGKVQGLAWAPNQDGLTQYLAVVVPISAQQKESVFGAEQRYGAPAFTPSPPYPAAVQIWCFDAQDANKQTKGLDMSKKPRLRLVLCTDWGHIRRIAWCPMPRKKREDDDGIVNLGLLACVCGDGRTRVVDVRLDRGGQGIEYRKYLTFGKNWLAKRHPGRVLSAAFTASPSATVSSCMAWLSPSDIAVACADGSVHLYNLVTSFRNDTKEAVPYMRLQIHLTYITNLSTAYPQYPHLLATTSMDGQTRLTSLLDPQKDMVDAGRVRVGTSHLAWSPLLQAFFSSDENDFLRAMPLRRFHVTTTTGRLPSTVSAMAAFSPWHPSCLVGCTNGAIVAVNPLRRMLNGKEVHMQLRIFQHEWARARDKDAAGPDVSRFIDGFQAEPVSLQRNMAGDPRMVNGVLTMTVYDEETHVTALAWNPNRHCAGWAVAGMGSGLIRLEDVSI